MNNWKTIESAPRDGTWVLGWFTDYSAFNDECREPVVRAVKWTPHEWETDEYGIPHGTAGAPTHWMSLPQPPTK